MPSIGRHTAEGMDEALGFWSAVRDVFPTTRCQGDFVHRTATYVQKCLGHAAVQLTLDRYSHWMPSMGRNTADGIDEALG